MSIEPYPRLMVWVGDGYRWETDLEWAERVLNLKQRARRELLKVVK